MKGIILDDELPAAAAEGINFYTFAPPRVEKGDVAVFFGAPAPVKPPFPPPTPKRRRLAMASTAGTMTTC